MKKRAIYLAAACLLGAAFWGCSDDASPRTDSGVPSEGGVKPDGPVASGPGVSGIVSDAEGVPIQGVEVSAGETLVYTSENGGYVLDGLTPGPVTVTYAQPWFEGKSEDVTVAASGMTDHDVTLTAHPLKIEAADRQLAESYNATFDWTSDTVTIAILGAPTRKELDRAIYYRNPAIYRDTSAEPTLEPSPRPSISGGSVQNITFPVGSGAQEGEEALDLATVVDTLAATPLSAAERTDWMMWRPVENWLKDWDTAQATSLVAAAVAVRQQLWGSTEAVRPQDIEQVFLHGDEIWIQVVFESFINVGAGISDSDGDGRKEIYARLNPAHYSSAIVDKLRQDYVTPAFDAHGMSKQINESLNELYSTTSAEPEGYIGQPYEIQGVGTIQYPFFVIKHSGGAINVLLVE